MIYLYHTPTYLVKIGIAFLLLLTLNSCQSQEKIEEPILQTTRIIQFSGYDWVVRTSDEGKVGPGPNYFSDSEENVWVDDEGRLHLKIVQKGGFWYCSGVTLRNSYGYNKYVFYVDSRVDLLNENVVGGLFTYKNDEEEIDIEFSRWSNTQNQDAQFAVQPSYISGNKTRYDLNLETTTSTHFFDWKPNSIDFGSYQGHTLTPETSKVINTWTYTGANIPPDTDERLKINLWLFKGVKPSDNKEAEMIINRVEIL